MDKHFIVTFSNGHTSPGLDDLAQVTSYITAYTEDFLKSNGSGKKPRSISIVERKKSQITEGEIAARNLLEQARRTRREAKLAQKKVNRLVPASSDTGELPEVPDQTPPNKIGRLLRNRRATEGHP